jgi:hypothetical protein
VGLDLEAHAVHADRVADAVLAVHEKVARKQMDDLAVAAGSRGHAGRFDDAGDVGFGDFPIRPRHCDDTAAVLRRDVLARDRDNRAGHL